MTSVVAVMGAVLVFGLGFLFGKKAEAPAPVPAPVAAQSFAECEKAGYPIMESYPRQCRTPEGKTYVEEILEKATYDNATADMITVELPFPGSVVGKDFSVKGSARGGWYSEGSFAVEVLKPDGTLLVRALAAPEKEWMTPELVPFTAQMKIPATYIGPATLILRKDNPSGLPKNDASMSFPITIQ